MMKKKIGTYEIGSSGLLRIEKIEDIGSDGFGVPAELTELFARRLADNILAVEENEAYARPTRCDPARYTQHEGAVARSQLDNPLRRCGAIFREQSRHDRSL